MIRLMDMAFIRLGLEQSELDALDTRGLIYSGILIMAGLAITFLTLTLHNLIH